MSTIERPATRATLPSLPGLTARLFDPEHDYPAVADLIATANVADGVEYAPGPELLRHEWEHDPHREPARDVLVVADSEGRPVGLAQATWRERDAKVIHQLDVLVRPTDRRRGIGSALAGWVEAHARDMAVEGRGGPDGLPRFLGGWSDIGVPGVLEFTAARGYAPIRYFNLMLRDLAAPIPEVAMPEGLEVRPVLEADHRRIWDADVEAFLDHFEAGVRTEEDFVAFTSGPDVDTTLWQVGWDGEEVAGSVITTIYAEENAILGVERGWLDHVSVRRRWRGRGLASALIARTLALLQERGMAEAALGVDAENPTGALGVYERLGFYSARTSAAFRKPFEEAV